MSILGIDDPWIWGAYVLCILSTLQCVVYGVMYWNRGGKAEAGEIAEELAWQKKEEKMEDEMGEVL